MVPRERPPRSSPEETRERLVVTARVVFNREGYFNTHSNAIAREAGYSPGTFYKHFNDKREIFLAAYESWVRDEWEELRDELPQHKTVKQLASHLAHVVLDHHRSYAGFRASLRALIVTDDKVRKFVLEQRAGQLEMLALLRARRGLAKKTRGEDWALLLLMERVCDSIASDEARELQVKESELLRVLERALEEHLQ
jgi:AcrR family transcriptional regulator